MLQILIILALLMLHGIIAMAEMAFVSSKKIRLEEYQRQGKKSAGVALKLLSEPEELLSTMQIGITVLEILAGVIGGASLADYISPFFRFFPGLAVYADQISYILVVALISYISIVIGDLVPKIVGLSDPENIACSSARYMNLLSRLLMPVVRVLSAATKFFIKILFIKMPQNPPITEEELRLLIDKGTQHGVLGNRESEMLQSILRFNDIAAFRLMTPRDQVIWLDFDDSLDTIYQIIIRHDRTRFPVCQKSIDNIVGFIAEKEFLHKYHSGEKFKLEDILFDPLIIDGNADALTLLDRFRETRSYIAVVLDNSGSTAGIITLHDLIVRLVGELPEHYDTEEDRVYKRDDGSLLIDAGVSVSELRNHIPIVLDKNKYLSVGAIFTVDRKRLPRVGDKVIEQGYVFEVFDMDGIKVDKIMVKKIE